uniref:Uncharacterized protein n=1 Tax=Arundo donax TaxID=35708 RepID=A0A0A9B112_ARUDO
MRSPARPFHLLLKNHAHAIPYHTVFLCLTRHLSDISVCSNMPYMLIV